MLGFCVGGTILLSALALLYARGEPVASLTLLTALLDFTDTGILDVYIDDVQIQMREKAIGEGGLMAGQDFASAFSSLRPNDLIWNYVESNYLKGEEPTAFDLLYWNADNTNLPGLMFCYYLRNMYLNNSLKELGKLTVVGEKLDLGKIVASTFIYASREDHIVPWTSARFALRVAMAIGVGLLIAQHLSYTSQGYWIVLTIAIILKPIFSQTKQRRGDRLFSTLIGCIANALVLHFFHEPIALLGFLFLATVTVPAFICVKY